MNYNVNINGIDVQASFSEENITNIFIPFLKKLKQLKENKGSRVLCLVAAPPGTGKTTLLSFLRYLSENTVTVIGMDGFHRQQDYLLNHTVLKDGKEIPMVQIKGAPVTFDLEKLTQSVKAIAAGKVCGWPAYDRLKHNPIQNALLVTGDIVLLEGNYLLLKEDGWSELRKYADYTVFIRAGEEQLKERLVQRKIASGASEKDAEAFVRFSDLANARLCLEKSAEGDLNLQLQKDNTYRILN